MKKLINLICFAIIIGCQPTNPAENIISTESIDLTQITKVDRIVLNSLFDSVTYFALDLPREVSIYHSDKLFYDNDFLVVGDITVSNTVYVFSKDGKFINLIEGGGLGPRELPDFQDFTYNHDKETLLFLHENKAEIIEFSLFGEYIGKYSLDHEYIFYQLSYHSQGNLWLYRSMNHETAAAAINPNQLYLYNLDNRELIASYFPPPKDLKINFIGDRVVTARNKEAFFHPSYSSKIIQLSDNGTRQMDLLGVEKSDSFFGMRNYNDFTSKIKDMNKLFFQDNFLDFGDHYFFLLSKGSDLLYGFHDKSSNETTISKHILDDSLNLPARPYFDTDITGEKLVILFNDELIDLFLSSEEDLPFKRFSQKHFPELSYLHNKNIIAIYE